MLNNKDNALIIKDNSEISPCDEAFAAVWGECLHNYSARTVNSLCLKHPDFNSIPFMEESQQEDEPHLFTYLEDSNILKTKNIGGFFGLRNEKSDRLEIRINSRFDDSEQQYFVRYMLSKISGLELLPELKTQTEFGGNFDFLLFLFPKYLRLALSQGIFRSYKYYNYNDSKPKGRIDVSRHLAKNIPFQGKVAYSFREYTEQNDLMLMIREVIEHISNNLPGLINNNSDFKNDCLTIYTHTPYYGKVSRWQLIELNSKPIKNPFYTNYELLRQLCIHILRNDELKFSNKSNDEIYGVVYDLSWLWEEYLNVLFKSENYMRGFIHTRNRSKQNGLKPFNNNNYELYPDFYREKEFPFVIDAKYKDYSSEKIVRDDILQLITYMHILKAQAGAFVFPMASNSENSLKCKELSPLYLNGFGGVIHRFPLAVPNGCESFVRFVENIKESEEKLITLIKSNLL
ncbi:5-methylcytosine restriction system specificity protein McrC [Succinivibrio dextrinosolvens]|nr:hypothetical protein [Succinivibrio dextrinosolvens]